MNKKIWNCSYCGTKGININNNSMCLVTSILSTNIYQTSLHTRLGLRFLLDTDEPNTIFKECIVYLEDQTGMQITVQNKTCPVNIGQNMTTTIK